MYELTCIERYTKVEHFLSGSYILTGGRKVNPQPLSYEYDTLRITQYTDAEVRTTALIHANAAQKVVLKKAEENRGNI